MAGNVSFVPNACAITGKYSHRGPLSYVPTPRSNTPLPLHQSMSPGVTHEVQTLFMSIPGIFFYTIPDLDINSLM